MTQIHEDTQESKENENLVQNTTSRFYIKRNATLHISNAPAFRDKPKSYADLCRVSKINVAYSSEIRAKDDKMLLPDNAQHNLRSSTQQESKERDNDRKLRWTISSDTGIVREQ